MKRGKIAALDYLVFERENIAQTKEQDSGILAGDHDNDRPG
jgi:hypothetical protein